jgi:hypothetical protein
VTGDLDQAGADSSSLCRSGRGRRPLVASQDGGRGRPYWLPLGAGGHFVRLNGRVYEAVAARLQRRRPCDLYHSALQVELPEATFVIEQAPVHDWSGAERGVAAEGPVGARWAGRLRILRYEIHLGRDGYILRSRRSTRKRNRPTTAGRWRDRSDDCVSGLVACLR